MKKRTIKREYIVVLTAVVLVVFLGLFSLSSLYGLQNSARLINSVGQVRGASQKLVKEELAGYPDNSLIRWVDSIVADLATSGGQYGPDAIPSPEYRAAVAEVAALWDALKAEIEALRAGGDAARLYELSEDLFTQADRASTAAEAHTERLLSQSFYVIIAATAAFLLFIAIAVSHYLHARPARREGEVQPDSLTGLPGRRGCERRFQQYAAQPPGRDVALFVFDMNNLAAVNASRGHKGGDEIISTFAGILKSEMLGHGFVGRWGGDEFVVVLEDADAEAAEDYLTAVNEKVVANNLLHLAEIDRISFAAGYVVGNLRDEDPAALMDAADRAMYKRKTQMREGH